MDVNKFVNASSCGGTGQMKQYMHWTSRKSNVQLTKISRTAFSVSEFRDHLLSITSLNFHTAQVGVGFVV